MRMKYLKEKERCKSAPPLLDESDENLTPAKKRYQSAPASLDMFDSTLTDSDSAVEEESFEGSDDDFEYGAAHDKTPKVLPKGSMQVNKKITREKLMAVTTPICARGLISIELQTWLLSSVVNYLGGDVNQMGISKSSISRERAKVIEHQGNTIRENYREIMAGKHLVLHFDGELLKHLDKNTLQSVVRDRAAVSVTSPEFEIKNDLLLGDLPAESGKAVDETEIIHNLLESFEICNKIFAIVADTTNVNTGAHAGIIIRFCYILGKPVLWLLCRRHMFEIVIVIVLGLTAVPDRQFYKYFKKDWEVYHAIIQKADLSEFKKFDEKKLEVGSELYKLYLEAQEYLKFALNHEVFPRDDYNHLVKYAAFYLNVSSPKLNGFKIHQAGANHNARFMADSLYNLSIVMTSGIIDFLPKDQLPHLEKSAFICAAFYAPWYLCSYKAEYAVKNDYLSFKSAYVMQQEFDVKIGNAFLKFFQQHSWYLAPKVAVLILADPDVEEKLAVLDKLLTFEVPDINTIPNGKPDAVLVLPTSE